MEQYVGKKIAELRKKQNLSVRELAKKVNITASMLSQIERGLANPSLNTLKSIATSLGVAMFYFLIPPVLTENMILRENTRKRILLPENDKIEYQLLSQDLSGNIEMMVLKLPSHQHSSEELTEHKGEEIVYIVDGEVVLYIEDNTLNLYKGDSVRILPFMKHRFENKSDMDVVIIFAISPPSF